MALSKSGKAGTNVTQLDAARKKRSTKASGENTSRPASRKAKPVKSTDASAAKVVPVKPTGASGAKTKPVKPTGASAVKTKLAKPADASTAKAKPTKPTAASTAKAKPTGASAAKTKPETRPTDNMPDLTNTDNGAEEDKKANTVKSVEKQEVASKPRVSNRRFDTEKVERLKATIAAGNYEINYLQVADKFIEHERYA